MDRRAAADELEDAADVAASARKREKPQVSIENAFSLFKRSLIDSFHHVSIKHLGRYCNEFSYRFNRWDYQEEMFDETVRNLIHGTPMPYKKLTASAKLDF